MKIRVSYFMEIEVGDSKYNVLDFGAKGDGKTDDTHAIQEAIDRTKSKSGMVIIPEKHTFLTKAIHFSASNTAFYIEGTLLVSNDRENWPKGLDM